MTTPKRWKIALILLTAFLSKQTIHSQTAVPAKAREYRIAHQTQIVDEFASLLALPNLATDKANIRRNADAIRAMLEKRGVTAKLLEVPDSPPIVYGEMSAPGAKHTLIFYVHYDGQPVDASQWTTPPWVPTIRDKALEDGGRAMHLTELPQALPPETRIYARSAGDDKAPIQALMSALDALKAANISPSVNLKFFFEGEEEAGSAHLPDAIRQYADLLRADAWILCDGPVHQSRRMELSFGARGVVDLEMTVYGPARVLHSGHYGNWAPNPGALMANLLASMRDDNAHIKIAGFYDDVRPLTDSERTAIQAMPDIDGSLRNELALAWTEGSPSSLAMQIMQPALNIRGIEVGHVGAKTQNAISTEARASIDFRLVPDESPDKVKALVERHIQQQGFYIMHQAPTLDERRAHARIVKLDWGSGYPAARTSIDLPVSRAVISNVESSRGGPIVIVPSSGGSVPMYLFTDVLKTPVINFPIANHDDNQHAANENLRLQNLWDGIEMFAGLIAGVENNWK